MLLDDATWAPPEKGLWWTQGCTRRAWDHLGACLETGLGVRGGAWVSEQGPRQTPGLVAARPGTTLALAIDGPGCLRESLGGPRAGRGAPGDHLGACWRGAKISEKGLRLLRPPAMRRRGLRLRGASWPTPRMPGDAQDLTAWSRVQKGWPQGAFVMHRGLSGVV